ncbi:transposase domain-containing protein, partial [Escherichia coli]|nr:transposase domain-containing protein [Escherichia coli]
MFFGSDYGSERTCCLNGIDPQAYLRHILDWPPESPDNQYHLN